MLLVNGSKCNQGKSANLSRNFGRCVGSRGSYIAKLDKTGLCLLCRTDASGARCGRISPLFDGVVRVEPFAGHGMAKGKKPCWGRLFPASLTKRWRSE